MILVIGGISEARELCARLAQREKVLLSVATAYGAKLASGKNFEIEIGRKNTADFLKLIQDRKVRLVIDCSHPFAEEVSRQIREAAAEAGVPLLCYRRKVPEYSYPRLIKVYQFSDAAKEAKRFCSTGKVFLATGSNHIAEFTKELSPDRIAVRVLDRQESADICLKSGIPQQQVITKRGPFTLSENLVDFNRFQADVLVTKESGSAGGTPEKIEAAEKLGIPVVLICPPSPPEHAFDSVEILYRAAMTEII